MRHIPIFVEGRSEPLINKTPESQPSQPSQQQQPQPQHHHPTTGMGEGGPSMDMPSRNDFFKHGTIFDSVRDMPVRSNFPGFHLGDALFLRFFLFVLQNFTFHLCFDSTERRKRCAQYASGWFCVRFCFGHLFNYCFE